MLNEIDHYHVILENSINDDGININYNNSTLLLVKTESDMA
jgi:hypothetical protein